MKSFTTSQVFLRIQKGSQHENLYPISSLTIKGSHTFAKTAKKLILAQNGSQQICFVDSNFTNIGHFVQSI